jgi:hypothetical protein
VACRLRQCVVQFREEIDYVVGDAVPEPVAFVEMVDALVRDHTPFISTDEGKERAAAVRQTALELSDAAQQGNANTDSEREQQQEKEQEQEKEKEKEREREREGEYTRDDEQHNPWFAETLLAAPVVSYSADTEFAKLVTGDMPFYPLHLYRPKPEKDSLPFPEHVLVSSNYFRPRWAGMAADRRLKNAGLVLEWVPEWVPEGGARQLVLLSLMEGETLRRIIHTDRLRAQSDGGVRPLAAGLALRTADGRLLDRSSRFVEEPAGAEAIAAGVQCVPGRPCIARGSHAS